METFSALHKYPKTIIAMFSRRVLGKSKMSQLEYWLLYCIPSGFQTIHYSFLNWMDLVWFPDNQKNYALLKDDDPFEQCRLYFWDELQDEVHDKEFIEKLYELSEQVDRGEVEMFPFDKSMLDEINDLVGDLIEESDQNLLN